MKTNDFDPLAYIESAFLDRNPRPGQNGEANLSGSVNVVEELEIGMPSIHDYIATSTGSAVVNVAEVLESPSIKEAPRVRFQKKEMSAPRPRRSRDTKTSSLFVEPELQTVWEALPRNIEFLCSFYDDSTTANYYLGEFKETRQDLIQRLLDPELTLEETSRLLGVCPATVRRYTNRNWLAHHRTAGGQRRFRLSDVVRFVEKHGRFPDE